MTLLFSIDLSYDQARDKKGFGLTNQRKEGFGNMNRQETELAITLFSKSNANSVILNKYAFTRLHILHTCTNVYTTHAMKKMYVYHYMVHFCLMYL